MKIESALCHLKNAYANGKLAGSWLISGMQGAGADTLIREFAGFLLTGKENEPLSFHQNLKWVEKDYTDDEKKDIVKTLDAGKALTDEKDRARKSEITVDDIRAGIQFLSLTASGNEWRILVIDSADDMNPNAANALLKLLEEPPHQAVIFLISHNMGRLLPTIRSRCRKLALSPPETDEMSGEAYQSIAALLCSAQTEVSDILSFCEKLNKNNDLYKESRAAVLAFLLDETKNCINDKEKLDLCIKTWDETTQLLNDIDSLYLDKKAVFTTILMKIKGLKDDN